MSFNHILSPGLIWCGICQRVREVILDAPWSSFDLITAMIVGGLGVYFLLPFDAYAIYPSYAPLGIIAGERVLGALFLLAGIQSLLVVAYCEKPPFVARLCARMAMAICFLILFGNAGSKDPPPPSVVVWSILLLASIPGIWRTRRHGP